MYYFLTEEDLREKGKLYKPQPKIGDLVESRSSEQAQEFARILSERKMDRLGKKKKEGEKKKSNLELFKEELKMIQEEREERGKYKGGSKPLTLSQDESIIPNLKLTDGTLKRNQYQSEYFRCNIYLEMFRTFCNRWIF